MGCESAYESVQDILKPTDCQVFHGMESIETPDDNPVEKLATSVYPSFALLAGMQLDLFTPLKDGSMNADQIAAAIGVDPSKLKALLYALVVAGFLNVEEGIFSNTEIANRFLVKGSTSMKRVPEIGLRW
jgi:hypothetical protein